MREKVMHFHLPLVIPIPPLTKDKRSKMKIFIVTTFKQEIQTEIYLLGFTKNLYISRKIMNFIKVMF